MPTKTKIEWADYVSNPLKALSHTGKMGWACVKLSPGCAHCWASTFNVRLGTGLPYTVDNLKQVEVILDEKELARLERFRPRGPFKNGRERALVFMDDMTDLCGDWVADEFIQRIFETVAKNTAVDFAFLTKRPERLKAWYENQNQPYEFPENIWIGISVENQQTANARLPLLQAIPASVRFISVEPLLARTFLISATAAGDSQWDEVNFEDIDESEPEELIEECEAELDWINYGHDLVENPEYREYRENREYRAKGEQVLDFDGRKIDICQSSVFAVYPLAVMRRVGKVLAGHLLDGVEWRQMPGGQQRPADQCWCCDKPWAEHRTNRVGHEVCP
jgi:protein gp37